MTVKWGTQAVENNRPYSKNKTNHLQSTGETKTVLLEIVECHPQPCHSTPVVRRNRPSRPQLLFQSQDEHVVSNVTSSRA
jgi:hypothetical protein